MPRCKYDSCETCEKDNLKSTRSGRNYGQHINADKTCNGCGIFIARLFFILFLISIFFQKTQEFHDKNEIRDIVTTISLADWKLASEEARLTTTIALFNVMKVAKKYSKRDQRIEYIGLLKLCLDRAAQKEGIEAQLITEHATLCIAQIAKQTSFSAPVANQL